VSIHQVGNDASGRIMEKLGMRFERETVDPSCARPVRVYAITRADWERCAPRVRPTAAAEERGRARG
jgi:RimJ/RimL family protein N-acetyltransferase